MTNQANSSEPNVPVRARAIIYKWDGNTLKESLCVLGYGKTADERHRGAPQVGVALDSWIKADQAIGGLKKIIAQIEKEGLPSTEVKVTREIAQMSDEEAYDE